MAELIDKKSALNALSSASYGNFNYVTARNAIDCIRTTTESEIRAKAIDEFAEKVKFMAENKWIYDLCEDMDCEAFKADIEVIAEQLKEE